MDQWQAVDRLLEAVPEFRADYEESVGHPNYGGEGELLLHTVMSDLACFYMEKANLDPELAARFWNVVEALASSGDEFVTNAVHVSLIEWFAWGDDDEQAALVQAEPHQGKATWVMVQAFRPRATGSRRSDRTRNRRNRRG
jgi:hypothetical protein